MSKETIEKQWKRYCDEYATTDEMDIEKHIFMASKVGPLLFEIDKLSNKIKLLEQVNIELKRSADNNF